MSKMKNCKACGAEIATSAKSCPKCGAKNKKPFYKKWCGDSWRIIETYIQKIILTYLRIIFCPGVFFIIWGKISK